MFIHDFLEKEKRAILQRRKSGVYRSQMNINRKTFVLGVGLLNVALGTILAFTYARLHQVTIEYPQRGTLSYSLDIKRSAEYNMYIQLSGFYQTYLKYAKSISISQLKGEATEDIRSCDPLSRDASKIIYPCGLIANSLFQDGFRIENQALDVDNITWPSEKSLIKPTRYRFEQITAPPLWTPYTEVPDLSRNYWLANWLTLAPFPSFRKLYGKVFLEKGRHMLNIESSYPFGSKAVVFSEPSWAGTKNLFLCSVMILAGVLISAFSFVTVDFLTKIGYREGAATMCLSPEECSALACFNLKEYARVYSSLRCSHFEPDALVFCTCHKSSLIFLRNYSLLIKSPDIADVKCHVEEKDEFLLYLEAIVRKNDQDTLRSAIGKNELFWEAYELLEDVVEAATPAGRRLHNIFRMFLFCNRHKKTQFEIDLSHPNLAAAALYNLKEYRKSEEIFEGIVASSVFDIDYIDLYSNILYLNKDARLGLLAQRMLKINSYRPETHVTIGNYYSLKKDHAKAIEYFQKAADLGPRHAISYTLIGHEYMELKDVANAIKFYTKSIRVNEHDYRAWFGMAQAYSSLKMYEYALIFFRRSVDMRPEDGFLWLNMGQAYSKLKRDDALKCFLRAVSLNEVEGLLHAADFHKSMKKYTDAVRFYEKYVHRRGREHKRISAFLNEYFAKVGNKKKAEYYGSLA
ncbi:UNVERIFIED_CONTAM: hypothetical protein PYX00_011236 [Menopon gallinae]|uniref:Uncharacterized protein n=1 Tax=Menopon gallinae TaxID=328185 RepID=A0AAW2H691_9NEOP